MPNNDLAIRFTEEKYSTKSEVAKELRISSVDAFWSNIISYRNNFAHITPLKTIEKFSLSFCGCPSVNGNTINIENKLLKVNRNYSSLFSHPTDLKYFEDSSLANCLRFVSDKLKLDLDSNFFRSLVRNDVQQLDRSVTPVANYLAALRFVKTAHINKIDEDYLASLYAKVLGTEELTSFYRTREDLNPENRVLIDRIYTCAPVVNIEPMMNSLFSFISNSTLSSGVKAAVSYFYINYIKPFDQYNDEIAVLVAKSILGHESIGDLCVFLPLETLLTVNPNDLAKLFIETQKSADLTYVVNYFFSILSNCAGEMVDKLVNLNAEQLKEEFFQEDSKYQSSGNSTQEVNEEKVESKDSTKLSYVQEELAISYIPLALDEKQASLVEQDLLERDPSLRKGEAHFYARHCSKGKKYTIAQYKKSIGCVYETARTSMDHLAELGYYRKEKIKNKFVYVPITRA